MRVLVVLTNMHNVPDLVNDYLSRSNFAIERSYLFLSLTKLGLMKLDL